MAKVYPAPNTSKDAPFTFAASYDHFINGKFTAPVEGAYFDVVTPTTGKVYTKAARGSNADIEKALDAAHAAADGWGSTSAAARARVLDQISEVIRNNNEKLAYCETVDNGKVRLR